MLRRIALIGLLAAGLLAAGGFLGWSGGYTAGFAAEEGVAAYGGGFAPFFIGIALLFKVLLVLFIIMFIGKLLFFWRGGPRGGHRGGGHKGHWRRWHDDYYGGHHGDKPHGEGGPDAPGRSDEPQVA